MKKFNMMAVEPERVPDPKPDPRPEPRPQPEPKPEPMEPPERKEPAIRRPHPVGDPGGFR